MMPKFYVFPFLLLLSLLAGKTLNAQCSLAAVPTPVTCAGAADGRIDLTVTNGITPYTYAWSRNGTPQAPFSDVDNQMNISGLSAGTYAFTVTDDAGCSAISTAIVTQSAALEFAAFVLNQPCGGAFSGKLKLDVTGGQAAPYSLTWSNGPASGSKNGIPGEPFTLSGLGAGNYAITLTSATGCSATTSATLTSAAPLDLTTVVTNTSCFGGSDGSIDLTITGGTPNYITLWSNGSTTEDQANLPPGTYTATVSDANGCSATTSATVGEPTRLTATAAVTNVACFGGQNGAIDLSVEGGAAVYTYAWNHTANTQDVQNLSLGTYIVTVTDANGCTTTTSATINQPAQQVLAVASVTATSTCTANDGSLNLAAPAGSQPPYSFNFTNGPTSGSGSGLSIGGLSSGTYTITLTDGNGCSATTSAVQTSPLALVLTPTATSTCSGTDGQIAVSATNGMGSFSYELKSGGSTKTGNSMGNDFVINNLLSGSYVFTIQDAAGCWAVAQTTVAQPPNTMVLSTTLIRNGCSSTDDTLRLNLNGGTAGYNYLWSEGSSTKNLDLFGIWTGTFTVTVTDAAGCTATTSATVVPPTSSITSMTATPIAANCNGFNGVLVVDATGAVAPITVRWQDAGGLSLGIQTVLSLPYTIPNLIPNTIYSITLTDATGCSATAATTVGTAGPAIESTATATAPSSCAAADGTVQVNILGGTQPFSYSWSGGNQNGNGGNIAGNTFTISGLKPGWHSITLTDAVGCQDFVGVEVKNPVGFGFSTIAVAPTGCALGNGAILVETSGGTAPYSYQWWRNSQQGSGGGISTTSFSIKNLVAGDYYLTIKSGDCAVVEPQVVVPQPVMVMASFIVSPASCGGNNGNVDLSVTGGSGPYTYNWSHLPGTDNPQDLTSVQPGTYFVTITEAAGCSATATVQVGGSLALNVFATPTQASTCVAADGAINLTVTGGTPPLTYNWNHLPGTDDPEDLTGLLPSTYVVTVTDAAGCTGIRSSTVGSQLLQVFASATSSSCNGAPTGIITIDFTSPASAVPPYSYVWIRSPAAGGGTGDGSNIAAEPFQITGLGVGLYTITVTNGEGCSRVLNASVFQGSNINFQSAPSVVGESCLNADGAISIVMTGGTAPYSYQWAGPSGFTSTQQNISNLVAGNYRVTVTDASGCTFASNNIVVGSPAAIAYLPNIQPVTCFGGSDGSITITVAGGTPPYTVQWTGPNGYTASGFSIGNLVAGTYTAVIMDSKGCTSNQTIVVSQPLSSVPSIAPKLSYLNCNSVVIDVTLTAPGQVLTYLWNTSDTNPVFTAPTVPGMFTVTVTNVTCGTTAERTIEVKPCGQIAGSVINDDNKNCFNDNEPGLASWIVKAEGAQTYYGTSQSNGQYNIQVEPGHLYTVSAIAPNTSWVPCQPSNAVLVAQPFDSVPGGDFLFKKKNECPMLRVNIGSSNLRRCFSNNYYNILYCNEGTATATNAYIVVTLDAALTPVSSNKPYTNLGNNQYRFNVGNVAIGQCGSINLYVKLDCNAPLGATHCSEAHIYPDTLCEPPSLQWSGASLRVRSECQPDSVHFTLKNVGLGDMTKSLEYIVIEDVVMMMKANVQLKAGDSTVVKVPARGTTWRMEVEQEDFHPGLSRPASAVEGCGATTTFSTGFVNVFPPDDADKFIDIDCRENTAAYDPNDKQAVPTGYGTAHYVEPNTPLTYTIRFQNTGNDTAFTVVLRDTLSAWLDPETVRPGASSHPYAWDLGGTGHLTFTFENILLPDTATNLDASQGFVQYTIWPKDSVPLESVVLNRAGIYFDFNPPIITNQTLHTLGRNFIVSSTWQPVWAQYRVQVSPNPMGDEARLEVLGLPDAFGDFRLQVFDLQGNAVRNVASASPVFVLKKEELPSGMYFFRVLAEGQLVGSGKVVVESE